MPPELQQTPPFKVRWNQVTWYSKLGAIVMFLGVIPGLSFYIGMQYELTAQTMGQELAQPPITSISKKNVATPEKPVVYFDTTLSDPSNGELLLRTDKGPVDITGWQIKSLASGKSYKIGDVNTPTGRTDVVLNVGDRAYLFSKGSPSENEVTEGLQYGIYLASEPWPDDVIQLLNPQGVVIDTLTGLN